MLRKTIFVGAAALCLAACGAATNASAASASPAFRASVLPRVGGASRIPAPGASFDMVIDRRPVLIKDRFYRSKPH